LHAAWDDAGGAPGTARRQPVAFGSRCAMVRGPGHLPAAHDTAAAGRPGSSAAQRMKKLTESQARRALAGLPRWRFARGGIRAVFVFKDFAAAMRFVRRVAREAERLGHHPDILIQWNRVTLTCTTHDAGGLTEKDFALAVLCEAAAGPG